MNPSVEVVWSFFYALLNNKRRGPGHCLSCHKCPLPHPTQSRYSPKARFVPPLYPAQPNILYSMERVVYTAHHRTPCSPVPPGIGVPSHQSLPLIRALPVESSCSARTLRSNKSLPEPGQTARTRAYPKGLLPLPSQQNAHLEKNVPSSIVTEVSYFGCSVANSQRESPS